MKKLITQISVALVSATLMTGIAHADSYTWATGIKWSEGLNVSEQRDNPNNALGAPSAASLDGVNFLSLGLGGYAIFDFGTLFNDAAVVFETTNGSPSAWVEAVTVYAIQDSYIWGEAPDFSLWTEIGDFTNSSSKIELNVNGPFRYLALLDVTQKYAPEGSASYNGDGFDVNAVGVNPVPEPATMLLFGTGLVGLAGLARRKKTD